MSRPRHRQFLCTGLCSLMLVGSTATSIRHSHERGTAAHGHGLGLLGWAGKTAPVGNSEASQHRHLVILGVEVYTGEPPASKSPYSPRPTGDVELALGWQVAPDHPATLNDGDSPTTSLLALERAVDSVLAFLMPVPSMASRPIWPISRCALCDCARGERSGVGLF